MKEPTPAKPDLFRDCPLAVRELAQKARKELRNKKRAEYAKLAGLPRPGRS